jgi:beta-lactamase regulating signal transducer with metallopeptidase domain
LRNWINRASRSDALNEKEAAVFFLFHLGLSNVLMASVLAAAVYLVARLVKRPALVHCLWLLVFLKLITPPVFSLPLLPADSEVEVHEPEVVMAREEELPLAAGDIVLPALSPAQIDAWEPEVADVDRWNPVPVAKAAAVELPTEESRPASAWVPCLIGAIWLGGSLVWFGLAALRILCFRRLMRWAELAPAELQEEAGQYAGRLQLKHWPEVWLMDGTFSPMLWVFGGQSRLILPRELLARLSAEQRGTLLVHELAHWRRKDYLVRYLEILVLGLYWWCPLAWWARHELRKAEEECCDAWVVWALPKSLRAYATALVDTVDFLSGAPPALPMVASGVGQVYVLQRRLTMIFRGKTSRRLSFAGLLAVIGLAVLFLPMLPTLAQQGEKGKEKKVENPGQTGKDEPKDKAEQQEKEKKLDQLRKQLDEVQKDFDKQRKKFEEQTKKLRDQMKDLGAAGPRLPFGDPLVGPFGKGKPDGKGGRPQPPFNGPPGFQPPGPGGRMGMPKPPFGMPGGFQPMGGPGQPDLSRKVDELERKLQKLIDLLEKRGPDGPRPPLPPGGPGKGPRGEKPFPPGGSKFVPPGERPNAPPKKERPEGGKPDFQPPKGKPGIRGQNPGTPRPEQGGAAAAAPETRVNGTAPAPAERPNVNLPKGR